MRGIFIAIVAILLIGGVAEVAYQAGVAAGAAAGAAGTAVAAYPYYGHPFGFGFGFFGLLFPLLFLFLIFGLGRALFWSGPRWGGYGRGGGPRMLDEWHHEMHEREKSGGAEKADR